MAVTTTSSPNSNAVASLYQAAYIAGVRKNLVYSQNPLAWVPPQGVIGPGNRGSAVVLPMFIDLDIGSSLSETSDISPSQLYAYQASVTPELYGLAVQLSQKLSLTSFTDVEKAAVEEISKSAAKTREKLAREAAIGGANVIFGGDATTRAACSTASTADVMSMDTFMAANALLEGHAPRIPGFGNGFAAVLGGCVEAELISTGAIIVAAEYGTMPQALLNGEIGSHLSGTRLLRSDMAKIFRGAGASLAGESNCLGAALVPGSTAGSFSSTPSSHGIGEYLTIGAIESTGADYGTATEVIKITGITSTAASGAFTFVGAGRNGGLMYAHSSGTSAGKMYHALDVHATVFMGADTLGMVYSSEDGLGPEGQIILPEVTGILHQFNNIGWKGFWGFGLVSENRVVRAETASPFRSIGH